MRLLLIIAIVFLIANKPTTRRGFFKNLRDNYIAGRLEGATSREEKRIIKRKASEKMRRRKVFERNVKTLVNGLSKRLKHRRSTIMTVVVGGVALVIWLCHKGSVGCERDRRKPVSPTEDDN